MSSSVGQQPVLKTTVLENTEATLEIAIGNMKIIYNFVLLFFFVFFDCLCGQGGHKYIQLWNTNMQNFITCLYILSMIIITDVFSVNYAKQVMYGVARLMLKARGCWDLKQAMAIHLMAYAHSVPIYICWAVAFSNLKGVILY